LDRRRRRTVQTAGSTATHNEYIQLCDIRQSSHSQLCDKNVLRALTTGDTYRTLGYTTAGKMTTKTGKKLAVNGKPVG